MCLEDLPTSNDGLPGPMVQGVHKVAKSSSKRSARKSEHDPPPGGSTDVDLDPNKRQKYSPQDYKLALTHLRKCGVCGCHDNQSDDLFSLEII